MLSSKSQTNKNRDQKPENKGDIEGCNFFDGMLFSGLETSKQIFCVFKWPQIHAQKVAAERKYSEGEYDEKCVENNVLQRNFLVAFFQEGLKRSKTK